LDENLKKNLKYGKIQTVELVIDYLIKNQTAPIWIHRKKILQTKKGETDLSSLIRPRLVLGYDLGKVPKVGLLKNKLVDFYTAISISTGRLPLPFFFRATYIPRTITTTSVGV
jgi:hypothetical protein